MTTTEPLPEQSYAAPRSPRWVALAALAVVAIVVGAVITVVVVSGGGEPATAASLSQVEASCGDWMDSTTADTESDPQWCTDMFAWMGDHSGGSMMSSSGGSMMDNMMWQGSEEMGKACRAWVSVERGDSGGTGTQQCAAMIAWMDGHMSSQGGRWMMQGR